MVVIKVGDLYSTVFDADDDLMRIIKEECSFEMNNWQFAREKWIKKARDTNDNWQLERALEWDGTISLMQGQSFPSGLFHKVILRMQIEQIPIDIASDLKVPSRMGPPLEHTDKLEIRAFQTDAFKAALNKKRGIIKAPTGSGKTIIGARIIAHLHVPTLILVDKVILIDQWIDALREMIKIPKGYVGKAQGQNFDPSIITVASVQSLMSWKKRKNDKYDIMMKLHPKGWGMVIEDECHHVGAEGRYGISMDIPAYHRFGFSATPLDRMDANLRVMAALGPMIYDIPAEGLIENGMLARPIITFMPSDRMYFDQWTPYIDVYRTGIVRNDSRNQRIVEIAKNQAMKNRKVLIFVDFIEHGEVLDAMLQLERVTGVDDHPHMEAEFVHGEDKDRERKFEWFKDDDSYLNVLVATEGLIGEGFDYKGIDVIIVADGGKSSIQTIQKIGRGMRVLKDKKEVYIFDFADRAKYLGDHARERIKIWQNLNYEVGLSMVPYME